MRSVHVFFFSRWSQLVAAFIFWPWQFYLVTGEFSVLSIGKPFATFANQEEGSCKFVVRAGFVSESTLNHC